MASHHFIGNGLVSAELVETGADPGRLDTRVSELVTASGLEVLARRLVDFPGGGLTAVWVLAESHLVLHHWASEGFATIDLHVCDFRGSNRAKAERLVEDLTAFCFVEGSASWRELHLEDPVPVGSSSA